MKEFIKGTDSRMLFGFGLLVIMGTLAAAIALGKVHQETSYGLDTVLGGLLTLSGGFAQWAFSKPQGEKPPSTPDVLVNKVRDESNGKTSAQ